jgi:hypothetical protein
MGWRATIVAVAAACVVAPVLHATAPGAVLDQSSTPDGQEGAWAYEKGYPAQTFTAGATGLLTDIVVPLASRLGESPSGYYRSQPANPPAPTGTFAFEIFAASSGPPDSGSEPLAVSAAIGVPAFSQNDARIEVDASFPDPAAIVQGRRYAVVLLPPPPGCWTITSDTQWAQASCTNPVDAEEYLVWWGQLGNPYAAGQEWFLVGDPFTPGAAWESKADVDLAFQTYVAPDREPPSAAPKIHGTIGGTTLDLSWSAAIDDVGVDHYLVYRGTKQIAQTTTTAATLRNVPTNTISAFSVRAVDTAGNVGPPSRTVSVVPTPRPAGVPHTLPAWALRLFAWQQHGSQGVRPVTPTPLPAWYAAWSRWRLNPLRIVGG